MAAGAWQIYNEFKLNLGEKLMDLSSDTFKMALFQSTSNCAAVALQTAHYATLTNEVANGNGYTTGGTSCAPTWTGDYSTATKTFDLADGSWTASGASVTGIRNAVVYDDSAADKDLVCYSVLDSSDITITDGNTLTVQINASGVFTLA